jgi:prepilin-type processing-associated H-X9-DG protein
VADPRPWDPATKQFGNPTQPGAYRIDHISRPQARIVYVDDGPEDWNNCWGIWYDRPAFWNRLEMRHDKGTTLGFCDGHSELWRWVEQDTINYMSQPWEQVETLIATNVQKKTNRDLRRLQIGVFGKLGWQ